MKTHSHLDRLAVWLARLLHVCVLTGWLLATLGSQVFAQGIPRPSSQGDYTVGRVEHRVWRVVDADPAGLNLRMSPTFRRAWLACEHLPNEDPLLMPVVRRIPRGSILIANNSPAGYVTMTDSRNLPWLKVCIGAGEEMAFARANASFMQPVEVRGAIGQVKGGALEVRSSPSASAAALTRILSGERFVVLEKPTSGEWCAVLSPSGVHGFVPRSRVKIEVRLRAD